jgi:hypothetical protein
MDLDGAALVKVYATPGVHSGSFLPLSSPNLVPRCILMPSRRNQQQSPRPMMSILSWRQGAKGEDGDGTAAQGQVKHSPLDKVLCAEVHHPPLLQLIGSVRARVGVVDIVLVAIHGPVRVGKG